MIRTLPSWPGLSGVAQARPQRVDFNRIDAELMAEARMLDARDAAAKKGRPDGGF